MKWSEEQELAISLRNRRLLVSAAAGSGKTAVLTERIFRRITDESDPADIDALLIMTFTRAAASEMRERIRKRLTDALEEESAAHGNSARCALLRRQNALLEAAKITTIDSFCLSILREHADLTDLDPSFRVGGEDELSLLRADVMESVLEDAYASGDAAFERFAGGFSQGKTDRGLQDIVLSVCRFAESSPWPDEWLADCEEEARRSAESADRAEETPWMFYLLNEMRSYGAGFSRKAAEALSLCDAENGPSGYRTTIALEARLLQNLSEVRTADELSRALSAFTWPIIGRNPKGTDSALSDRVKEMRKEWKDAVQKFAARFDFSDRTALAADFRNESETVCTVIRLARDFLGRYAEKKQAKNILDFGDLEHIALGLLWEKRPDGTRVRTALAEEYAARFREIFVDEYQDSNGVQEELLRAIDHGELFLVGDVKQSIYGFRLARPELFEKKYETYSKCTPETPVPEGNDTRVDLSKNFRSRREVLDTANRVFSVLMDRPVGGISYDEDASLHCGASYPEPDDPGEGDPYGTELLLTSPDAASDEGIAAESEAHLIAGRIRELVAPDGLKVADRATGKLRPAGYGDIAVLLRSAENRAETVVSVLMREGIPAQAEQKRGYFDALEVKTVLSLLTAIDNPARDIPFAAALRSPACGLTERELALLMAEERELEKAEVPDRDGEATEADAAAPRPLSLYERLRAVSGTGRYPEAEAKLKHLFAFLKEAADRALCLPLSEFVRDVCEESGCLSWASALPGGEVRKANLDMLAVKAQDFENTGYHGLYDFVRYIENLKKYDTDYGEAGTGEERNSAVRVMTIHKSKGLEFPVVFLAGLSHRFNLSDAQSGVIIDQDFGIAADAVDLNLRTRGATLKKNVLAERKKETMLGEEIRVLYVAMTRAKEKLILTAAPSNPDKAAAAALAEEEPRKAEISEVMSASSLLDWVTLAMRHDSARCGISLTVKGKEETEKEQAENGAEVAEMKRELEKLAAGPAPGDAERLLRDLTKPYPFEADVNLHVKRSVSEIRFRGEDADEPDAVRPLRDAASARTPYSAGASASAAEAQMRGTAMHRVMERLDYQTVSDEESMALFLGKLRESGALTEEEAGLFSASDFAPFLSSGLCARMRRAFLAGTLHREAQFVMELPAREADPGISSDEPVLIQGVIDAWFEEEGKLILVDYKTDRHVTEETLSARYRTQLALYRRALSMMEERDPAETLLWSFELGRQISL